MNLLALTRTVNFVPRAGIRPEVFRGLFGGLLAFGGIITLLSIISIVLWIWALVDILTNQNFKAEDQTNRLIWALVVIFLNGLGAVIYFVFGQPKKS